MYLSEYAYNRDNNFNLLRFFAAFIVLYTHSFSLLSGNIYDEPMRVALGMSIGDMAVDVFFVTSGFLITSSYFNRNSIVTFAWARILRIYPALIAAMLFCVLVVGVYFTRLELTEYFTDMQTYKYFFKNIILFFGVEYYLPGVFENLPYPKAVNGSLWTLPHEVKMYTYLAIILLITAYLMKKVSFLSFKKALLLVTFMALFLHFTNHFYTLRETSHFLPKFLRLFSAFFMGASFYLFRDKIKLKTSYFFVTAIILVISSMHKDLFFIIYYLVLAYLLFYIVYVPKGAIRKFNQLGDYSYGMYIYAYPVQQSLVALYPNLGIFAMVSISFIVTLIFSILSWHFIEKRALGMKNYYQVIEKIFQKRL